MLVQQRLAQALSPQQRALALPAPLREIADGAIGLYGIYPTRRMEHAAGPVITKTALARPHPQPQVAPQIIQRRARFDVRIRASSLHQLRARDQLTFANQRVECIRRLDLFQPVAGPVWSRRLIRPVRIGQDVSGCAARRLRAQLPRKQDPPCAPPSCDRW